MTMNEEGFFFFDRVMKVLNRFPGNLAIQVISRYFPLEMIFLTRDYVLP
jgi:hypothetical protein